MPFAEAEFLAVLVADPCDVPKLVVVTGYYKDHPAPPPPPPGGDPTPQKCRVYLNHALTDYYEFEDNRDIKYKMNIVDDEQGRDRVWVRHGAPARLVRTRAMNAEPPPLLDGHIAQTLLPAAAPQPWAAPAQQWVAPALPYGNIPQAGIDWSPLDTGYVAGSKCSGGCFSPSPRKVVGERVRDLDHELLTWLLTRGLVSPADVVERRLLLRDLSRRNANVLVARRSAPSHFVKLARGSAGAEALRREAEVYRWLEGAGIASLAPAMREHDPRDGALILEGLPEWPDLRRFHAEVERFPPEVGAAVGAALATLHGQPGGADGMAAPSPPAALALHRPNVSALRELSPASTDLLKIIQGHPEIGRELDGLWQNWPLGGLVHNDAKWDNVLVEGGGGPPAVRLVDWEHAGPGDPLWDVGSAIAGYLSFWVFSIEGRAGVPPEALPRLARHPLESMTPAISAPWRAYCTGRSEVAPLASDVVRAARLAGARLLLGAWEATQAGGLLNAHLVLHVQLAANLLARPDEALPRLGLAGAVPEPG